MNRIKTFNAFVALMLTISAILIIMQDMNDTINLIAGLTGAVSAVCFALIMTEVL